MTAKLDEQLLATVERVVRLTPTIVEVIVKAPAAARAFEAEALDRTFVYSINLHQRRQLAIFELERRGVLPTWFSAQVTGGR